MSKPMDSAKEPSYLVVSGLRFTRIRERTWGHRTLCLVCFGQTKWLAFTWVGAERFAATGKAPPSALRALRAVIAKRRAFELRYVAQLEKRLGKLPAP